MSKPNWMRYLDGTFAILTILISMALAAAVVAGLLSNAGPGTWRWYQWLIAAPFVYVAWLIVFMGISAILCAAVGKRNPKPRYVVHHPDAKLSKQDLGLLTALVCYRRRLIVNNLPLTALLEQSRALRSLYYRSWSPSFHIGEHSVVAGELMDPDLTEIGNYVFLGGSSRVVAHNIAVRQDGATIFFSAPVKIGDRATIGGGVLINPGCTIGADALIEPGSMLMPFTRVLAGEVWGGNPAQLRRLREGFLAHSEPAPAWEIADSTGAADARRTVAQALGLAEEDPAITATDCWDSITRMAIAAAIFDRYGISVPLDAVFRWHGLADVAKAISSGAHPENCTSTSPAHPTFDDVEMIPMLDPEEGTRVLAAQSWERTAGTKLRLIVSASFTAQPLSSTIMLWARAFGFSIDCQFAPFNQILQTLLDPASEFAQNAEGLNVVLIRPEDLGPDSERHLEQVLQAIERFGGGLMVGTLPPVVSAFVNLDPQLGRGRVDLLRARWRERLNAIPQVHIIDFAGVVETLGIDGARASGSELLTRAPYSMRVFQRLAIEIVRQVVTSRRSPAKVVAIDCDNTLWGGLVGEMGYQRLKLGADGKGRSFQLLQQYLLQLKQRGILLAVVSRNEELDVRHVFENHPEMILRLGDIAAWKVNLKHKSENLIDLAGELGLGLDSFVFLDDDPTVRLEVAARAPGVHVVPLPDDHALWCEMLARLWLFEGAEVTSEDVGRTQMMQAEERRGHEAKSAASLDEFLNSLELEAEIGEPGEMDWARLAQLTQRTNQFNTSLKRRGIQEVQAAARNGAVLMLRAKDRFGDYGIVGVAILKHAGERAELDTMLMSCRILGRGIEDAFLHVISATAAEWGVRDIAVPFVQGPRNSPAKEFLKRSGFIEDTPDLWELSLNPVPALPQHVRLRRAPRKDPMAARFRAYEGRL